MKNIVTITEDYVSFETAKLLKEKGFHEVCKCQYGRHGDIGWTSSNNGNVTTFARPTLQRAMKWLREVHHLYIDVGFGNDYKGEFLYMGDIYDLTKDSNVHGKYEPIIEADDYLSDNPKTYEEAVEAAIKYCLEHLI